MISKFFNFIFIPLLTLFIIWGLGWLWFATNIAIGKPTQDKTKTDAVIVLTGGNGRINAGLNLIGENMAPKLFISGVNKDVTKEDIFKSWKNPISPRPCCIFLGYKSIDTISNATEIKEWVNKYDIKSFRLVTSSYHMPRAAMEIKNLLPDTQIIKNPVFTDDFVSWKGRFWELTFSEYNKTLIRWMQNIK